MKLLPIACGVVAMVVAGNVIGKDEIKKVPLSWEQARIVDGGELYIELCAVCHGKTGKGDGPASSVLKKKVTDLTLLAAANGGEFPFKAVEAAITGKSRISSHGTLDMPIWGAALEGVRPNWQMYRREAMARQRIHNLAEYLSTLQAK